MERETINHELGTPFFLVHRRTTTAVQRNPTADVSVYMAYTVLRGHRCAIAIPNVIDEVSIMFGVYNVQ